MSPEFVVLPLGGIEAVTKPQVPVKTGTTNGRKIPEECQLNYGAVPTLAFRFVEFLVRFGD